MRICGRILYFVFNAFPFALSSFSLPKNASANMVPRCESYQPVGSTCLLHITLQEKRFSFLACEENDDCSSRTFARYTKYKTHRFNMPLPIFSF